MKRLRSFFAHYADARRHGFPRRWSIRAAWAWSAGLTPALIALRDEYLAIQARRAQRMEQK